MINLPDNFKKAIGSGIRTSLYPLVKIYEGVRIDDPLEDATQIINLSIKETNLGGTAYKPLILNSPSIKSSADIINNKFTISSVSLDISNYPHKGKIFSDNIENLLNAPVEIYYTANGINNIDDCLLIYTGSIRRFSQSAESVKLELEDATQQMLSTKIPSTLIPEEPTYTEKYIGKPYPMVYGFVDKSPIIPESIGEEETGNEELEKLTKFNIDKKNRIIEGIWETPAANSYGNEFLSDSHPLVMDGWMKSIGSLSVYDDGFFPIPQKLNYEGDKEWSYELNGITDTDDDDYKKITFNVDNLYEFKQSSSNLSASIEINSGALIDEEDLQGLPSRVYRPIDKIECFTFNDTSTQNVDSFNRIYGFTGYDIDTGAAGDWKPWDWDSSGIDGDSPYLNNWNDGDQTWWEPTDCNENTNFGVTYNVDNNWVTDDYDGSFPVDKLQNGNTAEGMYLSGRNVEGPRGEGNRSGMSNIKIFFNTGVASFPCSTKYIYDASYHSFSGMQGGVFDNLKVPYPAKFWTGESTPIFEEPDVYATNAEVLTSFYTFPDIGNTDFEHISYEGQNITEDSMLKRMGFGHSNSWTETNSFYSIKFGIPQFDKQGGSIGNDIGYVSVQLFNFYLLQDVVVDKPFDKDFFIDVAGRVGINPDNVNATLLWVHEHGYYEPMESDMYSFIISYEGDFIKEGDAVTIFDSQNNILYSEIIVDDIGEDFQDNEGHWFGVTAVFDNNFSIEVGEELKVSTPTVITSPQSIVKDILEDELGYLPKNIKLTDEIDPWQHSFTLNEQKEAREVFEGVAKSSLFIPSFNASGQFTCLPVHQTLNNDIVYTEVKSEDLLKYSFSLTKLDDVKNQVNVRYKKNYGSGEFDSETGYKLIDGETPHHNYETYDILTKENYPFNPEYWYDIGYYGLKDKEAKLEVETEYIRDDSTARKLQKRLVNWYANQHLIVKIDLPLNYINLEVGDYIQFDKLIGGKLAFGYDYTKTLVKNGQLVYKYFFINKISKSLNKVSIEAVQVHRGEYGVPDDFENDNGGNTGIGNFELGDWQDTGDYDDDTIVEEEVEEEVEEDEYLNCSWYQGDNNLNSNPQILLDTNIEGEFSCDVVITHNDEEIVHPDTGEVLIPVVQDSEHDASDYINVSKTEYTNTQGNIQGGSVMLSTPYLIPWEELEDGTIIPHNGIVGLVRVYYQGTAYSVELDFSQNYVYIPPPALGDVNADGIVNILDVVMMALAIQGGSQTQADLLADSPQGDMNDDGVLNIQDVVILVGLILGGYDGIPT